MNKIHIIDLLNKIANKEKLPKKIRVHGLNFELDDLEICYIHNDNDLDMTLDGLTYSQLNDIAEIIEEQEEIDIQDIENVNLFDNGQNFNDMPIIIKSYDDNFTNINNTINKLVQAVKYLDNKLKEK